MAMRAITQITLVNKTVSGTSPVQSIPLTLQYMFSAQAAFIVSVGAGLTATFQLMVSQDGVNYYNSGQVLPSVSGSASTFPVQYTGAFPYVLIQTTPSSGSGSVKVVATAKGGA